MDAVYALLAIAFPLTASYGMSALINRFFGDKE